MKSGKLLLLASFICSRIIFADSIAKPYIDAFFVDYARYSQIVRLTAFPKFEIKFDKIISEQEAYCQQSDDINQIVIGENQWNHLSSPILRKIVIYHELGHCFLGLDHSDSGIMQSKLLSEEEFLINRDKYLLMLFNSKPEKQDQE